MLLIVEQIKEYKLYYHFNRNTFNKFKVVQNQLNMLMEDSISRDTTLNC